MKTIIGRIQTPEDVNGERMNVDVITNTDAVTMPDGKKTLTKRLEELATSSSSAGIIISDEENIPDGPCLWGKILKVENYTDEDESTPTP